MQKLLILGGTTEASQLAQAVAAMGWPALLSYAGRTEAPRAQPIPHRIGGFGGAEGLAAFLRDHQITAVVDATHPFAAQISRNALAACAATATPLLALERPAWAAGPGDDWQHLPDISAAVQALSGPAQRIFLAIGRQNLGDFARQPQHYYLLRLVDPPTDPLPLPHHTVEIARGPFLPADDLALLQRHRITLVIAKNAGGSGAEAKLIAARQLGLKTLMIDRPALPPRDSRPDVAGVMRWLHARLGV